MKKAVFFDIDGTLIDARRGMTRVSCRVEAAIRRLQAAGHGIFLASGRPYAFLDEKLRNFGFDGYVLMNGAAVMIGGEIVYKKPLDPAFVRMVCAACEARGVEYVLQGAKRAYLKPEFQNMRRFYTELKIPLERLVTAFDPAQIQVYKLELMAPDASARDFYRSLVTEDMVFLEDPHLCCNFELYAKNETKAKGILHALQLLNIPVSASYAFGDGKNDIEMLRAVGCGIAMGNGEAEAKRAAKYVVASVHEDGVAEGIEKYILPE